uniref:CULLIN_2 domain-containing protein n=1 Tax=Steinernema glaseri TaxID=37863 RepID=A0A1I7ZPY1_9BILA
MAFTVEAAWQKLSGGLEKIMNHETMTVNEYLTLYQGIHDFCTANVPEHQNDELVGGGAASIVYEATEAFIQRHVENVLQVVFDEADHETRLRIYVNLFDKFHFSAKVLNGLYRFLNRNWVRRLQEDNLDNGRIFEIYVLCMVIWKNVIFKHERIDLTMSALHLLNLERDGDSGVDANLVKKLVESYLVLGVEFRSTEYDNMFPLVSALENSDQFDEEPPLSGFQLRLVRTYERYFETPMLANTLEYYRQESAEVSADLDGIGYMKRVDERLNEENSRSKRFFFDALTNERLQKTVEKAFIEEKAELFQRELRNLLIAEEPSDLSRMYKLCTRVDAVSDKVKKGFRDFVAEQGQEAIKNMPSTSKADPQAYVSTILEVYKKYRDMVKVAFNESYGFYLHLDEGCITFVNKNAVTESSRGALNKSAELLSKFVDQAMRKGGGCGDIEEVLDQAITVFLYIADKDTFQKYYNRLLSRRLLLELSVNDDYEKMMITRLKSACGHEYVQKSLKMFMDIDTSKLITHYFANSGYSTSTVSTSFQVLSSSCWPLNPLKSFEVPPVIQDIVSSFTSYYAEQHQGRKLTYLYGNSRGEVTALFNKKKFSLQVTTTQLAVLLKYNDADSFSFGQLRAELQLEDHIFTATVVSLLNADLLRVPEESRGKTSFDDGTAFSLNLKFAPRRIKIDLAKLQNQIAAKVDTSKAEDREMVKSLEEDRKYLIQAAIVRIMKMRRRILHTALITETVEQVSSRFQPKIGMIKQCIDILMEKEYMKRANDDKNTYEYIA